MPSVSLKVTPLMWSHSIMWPAMLRKMVCLIVHWPLYTICTNWFHQYYATVNNCFHYLRLIKFFLSESIQPYCVHGPHASIIPKFPPQMKQHMKIYCFFRYVDSTTYCDHTFYFVVHTFGLPLDAWQTSLPIVVVSSVHTLISFSHYHDKKYHSRW